MNKTKQKKSNWYLLQHKLSEREFFHSRPQQVPGVNDLCSCVRDELLNQGEQCVARNLPFDCMWNFIVGVKSSHIKDHLLISPATSHIHEKPTPQPHTESDTPQKLKTSWVKENSMNMGLSDPAQQFHKTWGLHSPHLGSASENK
ncbi:hypothetical protein CDAR_506041 [Caerostris darwini]|uniref:Uncharacterized protein n=1 Tax=Caerostris darwini TaxID=1538125 RepID=A0AAV4WHI1_9ARAC|nr:hypothetical protein CDAR_506041 [Caerostris darwini]